LLGLYFTMIAEGGLAKLEARRQGTIGLEADAVDQSAAAPAVTEMSLATTD
jgi:hypothetical protein